ncbi:hypothetical protein EVAR_10875_1 [Eumeta japonica]|uniref:Uncharacterized protein n=1 Tax=Eumeta variegata TaxID=151549 RepID=A0A4C1URW2_EUMVA|nr:hypothetical protein EVAR_10875_1 [Eumeta japonica]
MASATYAGIRRYPIRASIGTLPLFVVFVRLDVRRSITRASYRGDTVPRHNLDRLLVPLPSRNGDKRNCIPRYARNSCNNIGGSCAIRQYDDNGITCSLITCCL